jgi:biopolymer transport protein ExbB/TolQ
MRQSVQHIALAACFVLVVAAGLSPSDLTAQVQESAPQVLITGVQRTVHKWFLFFPHTVDYTVSWNVQLLKDGAWTVADPSPYTFRVSCTPERGNVLMSPELKDTLTQFTGLAVGKPYTFFVEAFQNGQKIAQSNPAVDMVGRRGGPAPGTEGQEEREVKLSWAERIPVLSGRTAYFAKPEIYDESSFIGRRCFDALWLCFLVGLYYIYRSFRHLALSEIFPMKRWKFGYLNRDRSYQPRLTEEYKKILREWRTVIDEVDASSHDAIVKDRTEVTRAGEKYWLAAGQMKIQKLIDRIEKLQAGKILRQHGDKETIDTERMEKMGYAALRVFKAGLDNHKQGGYRWLEVGNEVKSAIETRASSELEVLRRQSAFETIWNLGTIAPLLGLFGTVTGISKSFDDLTLLSDTATQKELIRSLAGGIHEALWTTIEGLIIGIGFMLLYYFFQKKLEWVYSRWEEEYVSVVEKL